LHPLVIIVVFRGFKSVDGGKGETAKSLLASLEQLTLSESCGEIHVAFTIPVKVRVVFPAESEQSILAGTTVCNGKEGTISVRSFAQSFVRK
jgi:hypothetical protein